MQFLKQSVSAAVLLGPLLDQINGTNAVTGFNLLGGQAFAYKNPNLSAVDLSGSVCTHITGGVYSLNISASVLDTCGMFSIHAFSQGTLGFRPVRHDYTVQPASVWNALIGGTTDLPVNVDQIMTTSAAGFISGSTMRSDVEQIGGSATAATNLEAGAISLVTGTAQTSSTTTAVITNLSSTVNSFYAGRTLIFTSGVLLNQACSITAYTGATKTCTVSALTSAPSNGDTFVIV